MNFRFRHIQLGGHTHVTLFVSQNGPETTHANSGQLVLDNNEWEALKNCIDVGNDQLHWTGDSSGLDGVPTFEFVEEK